MHTGAAGTYEGISPPARGPPSSGRERGAKGGQRLWSGSFLDRRRPAATLGQAVGVDLWRSQDQSGNDIQFTRVNAEHAGVADRIELHTADMTELPFADDSFDVVTSALAIQHLHHP